LLPEGSTPAGFVRVPADRKGPSFFIMEREVSCAEYLAFLDDPKTLRRVDENPRTLVPRGPLGEPYWDRGKNGFVLAEPWQPGFPVLGVSFLDAQAYVAWASARDRVKYALPTEAEWCRAAGVWTLELDYPFGDVFLPKFASSNWSRPKARVEPCMRYPVDESVLGAFDMSGSGMEWLDAFWANSTDARWLAGGAWGYSDPVVFRSPGGWGSKPNKTTGTYGFRMVLRP
jgi:formylglycine-generating enzyme required for sulfatase activity